MKLKDLQKHDRFYFNSDKEKLPHEVLEIEETAQGTFVLCIETRSGKEYKFKTTSNKVITIV